MKYIIILVILIIGSTASAQVGPNDQYKDSTITLQLPRCFSWWITKSIASNITKQNFKLVSILKPYVSDSTKPDSLFTVSLPAKYVQAAMELIITRPLSLAISDYLKVVENKKVGATGAAIVGYTALSNQIVSKANGNTSEKQVAIYLRNWFVDRTADFSRSYREERDDVIELTKQ